MKLEGWDDVGLQAEGFEIGKGEGNSTTGDGTTDCGLEQLRHVGYFEGDLDMLIACWI